MRIRFSTLPVISSLAKRWRKTRTKNRVSFGLISLLALVVIIPVIYLTLKPQNSAAAWFDDNWNFRQRVDITNGSGGDLTDFQIKITLDTSALITAGKLQNNCNDLRITAINGQLLPFWVEEGDYACGDADTAIWVKVPSIPATGTTVFVYYGNSGAANGMNPGETFQLFDTFSSTTLDTAKWAVQKNGTGSYSVSGEEITFSVSDSNGYVWIHSTQTFSDNVILEARTGDNTTGNSVFRHGLSTATTLKSGGATDGNYYVSYSQDHHTATGLLRIVGDSAASGFAVTTSSVGYPSSSVWGFAWSATFVQKSYINYVSTLTGADGTNTKTTPLYMYLGVAKSSSGSRDVEWARVRKYVATEPTTNLNTEESNPGPIAYWSFDDGQGQTAQDSGSNNLDGTLGANSSVASDDPTWASEDQCVLNKCLKFDGSNDFMTMGDQSELDFTTGDFSISGWIRPASLTGDTNILRKGTYGSGGYTIWSSAGELALYTHNGTSGADFSTTGAVLTEDAWNHFAFSVDRDGTSRIVINGIDQATTGSIISGSINSSGSNLTIGQDNTSMNFLNGWVDEIKIFPTALSVESIQTQFTSGALAIGLHNQITLSRGLQGYWKMDEGTGTDIADSSGNSLTGTATGLSWNTGKFGYAGGFTGGEDDYITMGDVLDLDHDGTHTISAWIYPTSVTAAIDTIVSKQNSSSPFNGWKLDHASNDLRFDYLTTNGTNQLLAVTTGNPITAANVWYHVVVTYKNKEVLFYVNGINYPTTYTTNTLTSSTNNTIPLNIGNRNNGASLTEDFNGNIDEVRVYSRTLSPAEINTLYRYAPAPVGYWKFDDGTGGTTIDYSGNELTGTLSNGPTWDDGKMNSGIRFDGSDDYVVVTHNNVLSVGNNLTLEAWIKPDSVSIDDQLFMHKGSTGDWSARAYSLLLDQDEIYISYYNGGWQSFATTAANVVANQWTHVVYTRDGTTEKFYINGKLDTQGTVTQSMSDNALSLTIGSMPPSSAPSEKFDGVVDEVRIYNYAISADQVLQNLQGAGQLASGNKLPEPLAYYSFDESQGQTVNNTGLGGSSLNGTKGADSAASTDDPTWKTKNNCKSNGCLSFDGGDITQHSNSGFDLPTEHTISAWIHPTSFPATLSQILDSQTSPGVQNNQYNLYLNSNTGELRTYATANCTTTETIELDTWSHVATTYSPGSLNLFINGSLVLTCNQTKSAVTTSLIRIGGRTTAQYPFNGFIDEVKIYNTALTADQIIQDMNAGGSLNFGSTASSENSSLISGAGNPPTAYWSFDEKQYDTCAGGTNDVCDKSSNGYDGAIMGSTPAPWIRGKSGSALSFTSSATQYINAHSVVPALTSNSEGTISYWFSRHTTGINKTMIYYGDSGTTNHLFRINFSSNNTIQILMKSTVDLFRATYDLGSLGSNNTWNQLTFTVSSTGNKLYVNGQPVTLTYTSGNASSTGWFDDISNEDKFIIAGEDLSGTTSSTFDGKMDEVKVYSYALSPAQVAYDYNRGRPLGHWQFDECNGSTLYDASGLQNNGTLTIGGTGGQSVVGTCDTASSAWGNGNAGRFNSALSLDGTDDVANLGNPGAFQNFSQLTVSAWIKGSSFPNSDTDVIISKDTSGFYFGVYDKKLRFRSSDLTSDTTDGTTTLSNDTWYLATATWDGSNVRLYLDGKLETTEAGTGTIAENSLTIKVGSFDSSTLMFNGLIDDLRLYNYALGQDQIKKLMIGDAITRFGPATGGQ